MVGRMNYLSQMLFLPKQNAISTHVHKKTPNMRVKAMGICQSYSYSL